jgi:hypothetical protein
MMIAAWISLYLPRSKVNKGMRADKVLLSEARTMRQAMWVFVISGALCCAPALLAQRMGAAGLAGGAHLARGSGHASAVAHGGFGQGGGFGHGPGFTGRRAPLRNGIVGGHPFHHRHNFNPYYSPYFGGAYWWNDEYYPDSDQQVADQPAPVVQAAPAPPPLVEEKPANPLLIELQGDRFVRLTGNLVNLPAGSDRAVPAAGASASEQLAPVVLVFRDGHRQEVTSYSIIGPAIYASGSYWTNGYWTHKILLADLNLPATLQANQERGVKFVLPSGPNQVITRP